MSEDPIYLDKDLLVLPKKLLAEFSNVVNEEIKKVKNEVKEISEKQDILADQVKNLSTLKTELKGEILTDVQASFNTFYNKVKQELESKKTLTVSPEDLDRSVEEFKESIKPEEHEEPQHEEEFDKTFGSAKTEELADQEEEEELEEIKPNHVLSGHEKLTQTMIKQCFELRDKGMTLRNIAKELGISKSLVHKILKEYDNVF